MRIYSTLSRQLEELPPAPGPVRMYFCGPTVYQRIHVGNARPFVISMWLKRWLERCGYDVVLVENITDVNDKIYDAAREQRRGSDELAREVAAWYLEDTDALGLGRPDHEPRVSETIEEIIALIGELIDRGLAYEAAGDVYFRVEAHTEYGVLSNQRPDMVQEQEPNELKADPRDFALWKTAKEGEDTCWKSPWGRGRPGWHIECSAMAERFLGPSFEIHGGGLDLVFPHHENELAQSRGAGRPFAQIWMHNGMLRLTGEKMSKSVGNIAALCDVLADWGRETLLLYFMTGLWQGPIDFSDAALEAANKQVEGFRNAFRQRRASVAPSGEWECLVDVLAEDFNTAEALAVLHGWRVNGYDELLLRGLDVFGLASLAEDAAAPPAVHGLAVRRSDARLRRDFEEADRLRDEIEAQGWEVRDRADGYSLVPKT